LQALRRPAGGGLDVGPPRGVGADAGYAGVLDEVGDVGVDARGDVPERLLQGRFYGVHAPTYPRGVGASTDRRAPRPSSGGPRSPRRPVRRAESRPGRPARPQRSSTAQYRPRWNTSGSPGKLRSASTSPMKIVWSPA